LWLLGPIVSRQTFAHFSYCEAEAMADTYDGPTPKAVASTGSIG